MNDTMKDLERKHRQKKIIIIIISVIAVIAIASVLIGYFVWKKRNSDTDKRYDTEAEVFNFLMQQAAETPVPTQAERDAFNAMLNGANQ